MSHKKLLVKHGGLWMDISIFEKFIAAVRQSSTPSLPPLREVASSSHAPQINNLNFFEDTNTFISKAKASNTMHEEQLQVTEYRNKLLSYLSAVGENGSPSLLTSIVTDNRASKALDLSAQMAAELSWRSRNQPSGTQTEALNLSKASAVESSKQPMKRPANEVIKKSNLKLCKVAKSLKKQPTRDTINTPHTTLNKEICNALLMNPLPPTPAASPRCMPHQPTTDKESTPLNIETHYKANTPSTSSASSIVTEHLDNQHLQNFTVTQHAPQSNSVNFKRSRPTKTLPVQKKIIKISLNMSEAIKQSIDEKTVTECGFEWVVLGQNGSKVMKDALFNINWSISGPAITRKILVLLFSREVLSTHTLSGKPSPAFISINKPIKSQLDPLVVGDLIEFMAHTKDMSSREVRNAITTKCADEFKMLRQRMEGGQENNFGKSMAKLEPTN